MLQVALYALSQKSRSLSVNNGYYACIYHNGVVDESINLVNALVNGTASYVKLQRASALHFSADLGFGNSSSCACGSLFAAHSHLVLLRKSKAAYGGLGLHNAHLHENISVGIGVTGKYSLFADINDDNTVSPLIRTGRLVLVFLLANGICLVIHFIQRTAAHGFCGAGSLVKGFLVALLADIRQLFKKLIGLIAAVLNYAHCLGVCLFKFLVLAGFKLLLLTFKSFRLFLCLLSQLSKLGVLPVKGTSGSFQLSNNLFKAAVVI